MLADHEAREKAMEAIFYLMRLGGAVAHQAFIKAKGISVMVQIFGLLHPDPLAVPDGTGHARLFTLMARARGAGCLRAIMKPDPAVAQEVRQGD